MLVVLCICLYLASVAHAELPSIGSGGSGDLTVNGASNYSGEKNEITVMIYMIGSNLESDYGFASQDILEIAQSGADFSSMNVVLAAGGASHWQELSVQSGEVCFGTIRRDTAKTGVIWDQRVPGSISSENMLSRFLNYAYYSYPAKRYALIFWNHGGGPLVGFGHDEVSNNLFGLGQLNSALKNSPFADTNLEWIGFDACLMGSLEVAFALAPFTNALIFSQETEPGEGWNYSFMKEYLGSCVNAGKIICDCYADSMQGKGIPYTISLIDTRFDYYVNSSQKLLHYVFRVNNTDRWKTYTAQAAYASQSFGLVSSNSTYDLYDLADFVQNLCEISDTDEDSTDFLIRYAKRLVTYNRTNIPNANGLSFYFPLYTDPAKVGAIDIYDSFAINTEYLEFLKSVHGLASGTTINGGKLRVYDGRSRLAGSGEQVPEDLVTFSWQMTDEQTEHFVKADYVILSQTDDGAYDLIRRGGGVTVNEEGLLSVSVSSQIDCLPDADENTKRVLSLIERERTDDETVWFLPAMLVREKRVFNGSLQYFDRDGQKTIGEFVPYDGTDVPPKHLLSLQEGDDLVLLTQRYLPIYGDDGLLLPFNRWEQYDSCGDITISIESDNMLFIESTSALSENYYLQIIGMDADGNCFSSPLLPFIRHADNEIKEDNT